MEAWIVGFIAAAVLAVAVIETVTRRRRDRRLARHAPGSDVCQLTSTRKAWLVRSIDGRTSGPFSATEAADFLRDHAPDGSIHKADTVSVEPTFTQPPNRIAPQGATRGEVVRYRESAHVSLFMVLCAIAVFFIPLVGWLISITILIADYIGSTSRRLRIDWECPHCRTQTSAELGKYKEWKESVRSKEGILGMSCPICQNRVIFTVREGLVRKAPVNA